MAKKAPTIDAAVAGPEVVVPGDGIEYEYTGPALYFIDSLAGTRKIWEGKGTRQRIDPAFVSRFEAIYVNCEGPQMVRTSSASDVAAAVSDKRAVPGGTPYSGFSYDQIASLYIERTGLHPTDAQTAVELVAGIMGADEEQRNHQTEF